MGHITGSRSENLRAALRQSTGSCWATRKGLTELADPEMNRLLNDEIKRLEAMHCFESSLSCADGRVVAGVDEAGRGPLAGPVVAAAAILPRDRMLPGLNDSKKVPEQDREYLYRELIAEADFGVGIVGPDEIDEINILQATMRAMRQAVGGLKRLPELILVDAVHIPDLPVAQHAVIHGDALCASIAGASIIAKVTRDRLMLQYDRLFPQYGFAKNKGYATPDHLEALRVLGPSPIHRRSFRVHGASGGEPAAGR